MKYYAAQMCDKGTVAVDDTILVKDVQTTAGSHILEGFKPLFSADNGSFLAFSSKTMPQTPSPS